MTKVQEKGLIGTNMKHKRLKLVAGILVAVAAGVFLLHTALAPRVLRIAVGPATSPDVRVIVAFMQTLLRERASLRLRLVLTNGSASSATAMDEKKVDLAVVRSDVKIPEQSATVAIMRREAVYFIARPGSMITRISQLRGKTIGIVSQRQADVAVLERVLNTYDVPLTEITLFRATQPEIVQAVQEGRLDAVFVVAPTVDRMTRLAFQNFPKTGAQGAEFLPVAEAAAIAEQFPIHDTIELVRGALGVDPPQPDEETSTLAVTHRLVASRNLDEGVVSELTRLLFSLRLVIATEAPAANQIEVPSTESRGAKLPIHPGTIAYVEGETKTFFDRYGDWLWFGVMALSLAGSAVAAALSSLGKGTREDEPTILLTRVLMLTQSARSAPDPDALGKLEMESDAVRDTILASLAKGTLEAESVASMSALLAEMHRAMNARRVALALIHRD